MPRQRRVVLPGRPHHITQRGNNRRDVFFEDKDHELYLSLLSEYTAKYQMEILGYCLMYSVLIASIGSMPAAR
jgi:putative transposase